MDMEVIKVPCCVCASSGKVKRLLVFKRDCPVITRW